MIFPLITHEAEALLGEGEKSEGEEMIGYSVASAWCA